ncbi:MAG: 1-acyl-sn-glycerol-3-phosphate acyltransferase [Treponema sp.]|nr:1-acyl-sn-glycerol-3-phosphate acyltransferase [Treponema sp.]
MELTLREKYGKIFAEMINHSKAAAKIDETCVFEEANVETRKYMDILLAENILPESGLGNVENFKAFYDAVTKEGKHGLIMMEHYSNTDLPGIIYLLNKHGEDWSKDLANRIIAIAGMKLNEASAGVRAFCESYSRVVVYPSRSLDAFMKTDATDEEKAEEEKRARKINFAAMRAMDTCKKKGQVILVFPSGTRYRPGKPETKKGLREIDSYLRLFDVMMLVSINGNCLRINPENPEDMLADLVVPDVVTMTASPVIECKKFRNDVLASLPADCPDPKVETVGAVMKIMNELHDEVEKNRK